MANAERELEKARTQLDDLRPLLAEGFITEGRAGAAEQAVARAQEELTLARRRRDALVNFGRPLELSQARSDAQSSKESLRQLESGCRLPHRAEAGDDLGGGEPHRGGGEQARAREAAARALRGAGGRPRHRRLQGRLLRLRAEEAPGGRPGLGQPAAPHPARHLEDGRGDEGARDRHPQGGEEPEGHGARGGLPRPEADRQRDPRGHARPGGEGAPGREVLRGDRAGERVRSRASGPG